MAGTQIITNIAETINHMSFVTTMSCKATVHDFVHVHVPVLLISQFGGLIRPFLKVILQSMILKYDNHTSDFARSMIFQKNHTSQKKSYFRYEKSYFDKNLMYDFSNLKYDNHTSCKI